MLPGPHESPAHYRAKFGLWPWGDAGDQVFVQWCVEKGVDGTAAPHFSASDVLDARWAWHAFLAQARSRAFDTRLKEAEARTGLPLTFRLEMFTATPGGSRGYQGRESQTVVWQFHQGRLVAQEASGNRIFHEQLLETPDVRTLALLLSQMADSDWCWVDFGVGVVLPLRQDTWEAQAVYDRVLAPWADLTVARLS